MTVTLSPSLQIEGRCFFQKALLMPLDCGVIIPAEGTILGSHLELSVL